MKGGFRMVNSEQKHHNGISHCAEYIAYRNEYPDQYKNNTRCTFLFNRLEAYEREIGVTFEEFDDNQMNDFYRENIMQSVPRQAIQKVKFLQSYLTWLRENEYLDDKSYMMHPFFRMSEITSDTDTTNGVYKYGTIHKMTEDSSVDLDHVRNTMFFSPQEFEDYCKTVLKKDNLQMELAIYCLAWCGVPIKSIGCIRRDWVDENNKTVLYPDQKHPDKLIEIKIESDFCFDAIVKVKYSVGYTVDRESNSPIRVEYKQSDYPYLIRQADTKKRASSNVDTDDGYSRIRGIMSHLMTKLKNESSRLPDNNPFKFKRVSLRNVYSSGIFYRYSLVEDEIKNPFVNLGNCRYYNYIVWKKAMPES